MKRTLILTIVLLGALSASASANEFADKMKSYFESKVRPVLAEAVIQDAIKAQNNKNAALTPAEIDTLDKDWRTQAKAGRGPLLDTVLANPVSQRLKTLKADSNGTIAEIFVIDAKGLNVGQSDITSDYMQGDEAKWQKTYAVGPNAVFIDEVDFDDSSQAFQAQISVTITDQTDGQSIGAVTVGLAIEKLP